jgi:ABC-2 type transport system permease protein
MSGYFAILKCRVLTLFQYRTAAAAGLVTQLFWGFIKVMIFSAFYANITSPPPLSLPQAITFIWLGQALLQLLPWNLDKELEAQVKSGNVAYELLRPLDLYWYWYSRALAMRVIPTLMRSIPVFLLAIPFFGLELPASFTAGIGFILSVGFGALLAAAITTLVIISLFWTVSGEGIQRLMPSITLLFSGVVVPLPLFPEWAQQFLNIQPFRGVLDIPSRIYTGVIVVDDIAFYLGFQFLWSVVIIAAGKMLMKRAVKQMVIQGG